MQLDCNQNDCDSSVHQKLACAMGQPSPAELGDWRAFLPGQRGGEVLRVVPQEARAAGPHQWFSPLTGAGQASGCQMCQATRPNMFFFFFSGYVFFSARGLKA